MSGHLQFDEDFDLYVLGALDAEERTAFEQHLQGCEDCAERLAAARQRMAAMGLAAPAAAPRAEVKQRLMERVRQESLPAVPPTINEPKRSWWQTLWAQPSLAWACAAVIAVVAMTLAHSNYRLQQRLNSFRGEMLAQQAASAHDREVADLLTSADTQRVVLVQATDGMRPEGRVYYRPSLGLLFYAANLPAAPSDRVYQLWLVPSTGAPISAGVFQSDAKGNASIVLPRLPAGVTAKAFAVTMEPAGGVLQPTGPKVLIGAAA